jgi:hypothetical protein
MPDGYTARFATDYSFSATGDYTLTLIVQSAGGRETQYEVAFSLILDTEAPTISGAQDISAYLGDGISYRSGVSTADNCDSGVTLTVDTSAVDLTAEGTYPVIYTATDAAGNTATVEVYLYLYREKITEEALYAELDALIAEYISTDASLEQQVRDVYTYVYYNITYDSYSDKSDWVRAAYDGLRTGKGDCFTYFALSKAFFNRLGIENMDIQRTPGIVSERHYWNYVNISRDSGNPQWYHFDACRLSGVQHNGCLLTDTQVQAYTKQRADKDGNTGYFYVYDTAAYPASATKIITQTPSLEPYY